MGRALDQVAEDIKTGEFGEAVARPVAILVTKGARVMRLKLGGREVGAVYHLKRQLPDGARRSWTFTAVSVWSGVVVFVETDGTLTPPGGEIRAGVPMSDDEVRDLTTGSEELILMVDLHARALVEGLVEAAAAAVLEGDAEGLEEDDGPAPRAFVREDLARSSTAFREELFRATERRAVQGTAWRSDGGRPRNIQESTDAEEKLRGWIRGEGRRWWDRGWDNIPGEPAGLPELELTMFEEGREARAEFDRVIRG